ncbi:FMRFamide receptor-like [Lingula anatina]|uniref:FMRFamide receptor-like n=1 Tax=Lingula anatina TaxID=7574 RepID=A0A1S3J0N5_LINAN|nr:FMRFamide receptor-like [Lingula anatina]XP_013412336.1 FMRFamide receptor-like [Lingula anatina]|eukprot:XP_013403369.1 FMRFamide receptor-like [Lingula anatina]
MPNVTNPTVSCNRFASLTSQEKQTLKIQLNISEESLLTMINTYLRKNCPQESDIYEKIQKSLLLYIPIILVVIGTFGNIFSFIVLRQKAMMTLSTYFYLAALSLADTVVLYFGLFRLWIWQLTGMDVQHYADWSCKLVAVIGYSASDFSVWLIIAVTVERYIVVCHPLKASELCNIPRAKIVMGALFMLLLTINLHFFWTVELSTSESDIPKCDGGPQYKHLITEIWPWVDAVIYSFLPFGTILIMNCIIIRQVIHARRSREELQNTSLKERRRTTQESSIKLTIMLLTVSFTFVLTTLPINVFMIAKAFFQSYSEQDIDEKGRREVIHTSAKLLMYLNHSINFFLYCATGQKFRHQVKRILCRRSKTFFSNFTQIRNGRESMVWSSTKYTNCPSKIVADTTDMSEMEMHRLHQTRTNQQHPYA